jgi:anti-sigma factor RsiW
MTHEAYRELIQRAIDEDLTAAEQAVLDVHIKTCAECRCEYEEYRALADGLAKLSKVRPEKSFVGQMTPEIRRAVAGTKPASDRRVLPLWRRALPTAAAVVLGISLSVHMSTDWLGNKPDATNTERIAMTPPQVKPLQEQPPQDHPSPSVWEAQPSETQTKVDEMQKENHQAAPKPQSTEPIPIVKATDRTARPGQALPAAQADLAEAEPETGDTDNSEDVQAITPPVAKKPLAEKGERVGIASVEPEGHGIGPSQEDLSRGDLPHVVQVGPAPVLGDLNEAMQSRAQAEPDRYGYVTDPVRVVAGHLRELGFADDAVVTATHEIGRVEVTQGGERYAVRLVQPYATGPTGLWKPVSIARYVTNVQPGSLEKPVFDFFQGQQEAGLIHSFSQLLVLEEDRAQGTLVVEAIVEKPHALGHFESERVQYRFHLIDDQNEGWKLTDGPVEL